MTDLHRRRARKLTTIGRCLALTALLLALAPATASAESLQPVWSAPVVISSREAHPYALACPTSSFCIASDLSGDVITSSDPAGGASAWSTARLATTELFSISCPSSGFCAAAGTADAGAPAFTPHGEVWTSTDPAGGASAWHSTAIGGETYVTSISCPSAGFCAVVAETVVAGEPHRKSELWTSTNPTGGSSAWQAAAIDPGNGLSAVDCPSVSWCVAVDGAGNELTSTDPAGGAGAWSAPQSVAPDINEQPVGLYAVSCPTTSFCAATTGGDYIGSESPTTGNLVYSFNPTGGASAWTVSPRLANGLFSLSCPVVGECLSVDYSGNAYDSVAAEGGFGWNSQTVEPASYFRYFVAAACPSTASCFLLDSEGNFFVGSSSGEPEPEPSPGGKPPVVTGPTSPPPAGSGLPTGGGAITGNGSASPTAVISSAQLAALLKPQLLPHGNGATTHSLLKHGGLVMPFTAPEAGTLSVSWFLAPGSTGAHSAAVKPVLIASGKLTFAAAGTAQLTLRLTAAGRRRLRHMKRVRLVAQESFVPSGAQPAARLSLTVRLGR